VTEDRVFKSWPMKLVLFMTLAAFNIIECSESTDVSLLQDKDLWMNVLSEDEFSESKFDGVQHGDMLGLSDLLLLSEREGDTLFELLGDNLDEHIDLIPALLFSSE